MSGSQKNVLLISQLFPPISGVGGLRTAFFSKYLSCYGWNPLVLTTESHPSHPRLNFDFPGLPCSKNITRVAGAAEETDKDIISRVKRAPYKVFCPELCGLRKFYHRMSVALRDICRSNRIDAIFASSGPEVVHCLAGEAHRQLGVPWIADFRDIPEQWRPGRWIDRWQWVRLRRRQADVCSSAACLTTVSKGLADQLHARLGRAPVVITNGFDDLPHVSEGSTVSPYFTITYTGSLYYDSHSGPKMLLDAVQTAVSRGTIQNDDVHISFVGSEPEILSKISRNSGYVGRVDRLPRVSYLRSLELQRKSCVLLHFSHQATKGILTTKLFEYLGARRPIISIPGDDEAIDQCLRDANAGISCSDVDSIVHLLSKWYREWKHSGTVAYQGKEEEICKYTRKNLTRQLADILDLVITSSRQH